MSSLEAVASEEAESPHHPRLWKAWVCGQGEAFHAELLRLQVDPWATDLLHSWMPDVPPTHDARVQQFPADPTEHYQLMCTLLDAAMTANPAYWDTDQMRRWMDVLVERQYPWFVCSVWTLHRTEAISLLHASSLTHHHTSNLHHLLHKQLIPYLWFEADDFLESLDAQVTFFKALPTGRRGRGWRRELYNQFEFYPYGETAYTARTVKALVVTGNLQLLQAFLSPDNARGVWRLKVKMAHACIDFERLEMLEWLLLQQPFKPTVAEWYELSCYVHPYYLVHRLHRSFGTPKTYRMLRLLLQQFDAQMPKEAWLRLFTYSCRDHSFVHLLVCSYSGEALLDYVWTRVCEAAADIDDVYTLNTVDERRCVRLTSDVCACPKRLFRTLEALTKSVTGWTALANALRWGTAPVVKWLIDHGADTSVTCETRDTHHNVLSLACYNRHKAVLKYVLQRFPLWCLEPWLLMAYQDIVRALTRYTLPLHSGVERFKWVTNACVRNPNRGGNHEAKDTLSRMKATFKTDLVEAVMEQLDTLEHKAVVDEQAKSHHYQAVPCVQDVGSRSPAVIMHPMLQLALKLPGILDAKVCADLFVRCHSRPTFHALYTRLGMSDASRTRNLAMLYDLLVHQMCSPESQTPLACLDVMEQCPAFRQEMRNCTNSMVRIQITSSWARHLAPLFEAYLERARKEWRWNLSYDLNLIGWTLSSRDPQRVRKWHALLSWGHYPLLSRTRDQVYQHLAKTYRVLRRALWMRGRALQTGRVGSGRRYHLLRVHWELACVLPDESRPVYKYIEYAGGQRLRAGASL